MIEFKKVTPEMVDALLRQVLTPPEETIHVVSTGDEIPISEMEACISANGQMPPLPPLPDDAALRGLSNDAMSFLVRVVSMSSTAFAHLRQKADFDNSMRQLVVLERHMLQRQGILGDLQ